MKLAIRTTQTPTKISQTLEEVTHHHEAYDDLMFMLHLRELDKSVLLVLPVQGGVQ